MVSPESITLYLSPGSCSLAAHILLHEAGAAFDIVKLSVANGFPADFLQLNPKARVPILRVVGAEEEYIVTETAAIFTAISQRVPEKRLLGATALEVVRAYEWINYLSGTLHGQAFGCILRPHRFSGDSSAYDGIRAKGRETTESCFDYIEGKLQSQFAVGSNFTAVDAFLYVFWRWGCGLGIDMARYRRYAALARQVSERLAGRKALAAENIPSFVGEGKPYAKA